MTIPKFIYIGILNHICNIRRHIVRTPKKIFVFLNVNMLKPTLMNDGSFDNDYK